MNFAKNLQASRKAANLSQESLAEQLRLSRQAISKWEIGQSTPDMDTLMKLCEVLNVTPNQLLLGSDEGERSISQARRDPFTTVFVISSLFLMVVCACGAIMFAVNLNRSEGRSIIPEIYFLSLNMIMGSILVFAVMFIAILFYWIKKRRDMDNK